MDRQRSEGGPDRTVATAKDGAGQMVGHRHPEGERREKGTAFAAKRGAGRAMDAVREVVHSEGKSAETETPNRPGDNAMEAVRRVVEEEE